MESTLAYYRASLADAQIMAPKIDGAAEISHQEITNHVENAKKIIRGFHTKGSEKPTKKDDPPTTWPVTIVYLRGGLPVEHGYTRDREIKPILCLRATLQEDGRLLPVYEIAPWIPRNLLSSDNSLPEDVIGELKQADGFYTAEPYEVTSIPDIGAAIEYAMRLLSRVTGIDAATDITSIDPYAVAEGALLVDASESVSGATKQLINLVDFAVEANEKFPLAEWLVLGRTEAPTALPASSFWEVAARHGGTMSSQHPLSMTQREAMHHFVATGDGSVVAVNGPPGTGKTTLLQSIVAQLVVERAAQPQKPKRPDMPLIVATSANNQAVTNVIDSFGKVFDSKTDDIWSRRWVPDVPSYGCFAASEKKGKEGAEKGYLVLDVSFDKGKPFTGFIDTVENAEWLQSAKAAYLTSGGDALLRSFGKVDELVDALHEELKRTLDENRLILDEMRSVTRADASLTFEAACECKQAELAGERVRAVSLMQSASTKEQYLKQVLRQWDERQRSEPWWFTWLSFLPAVKQRRIEWAKSFFATLDWPSDLEKIDTSGSIVVGLSKLKAGLSDVVRGEQQSVERIDRAVEALSDKSKQFDEILAKPVYAIANQKSLTADVATLMTLSERLDVTTRAYAFRLAARYWEGRYLLELEEKLSSVAYDSKAPKRLERMLRRIAMLTPCTVSTMYSLPKFYRAFDRKPTYLLNTIDLLVVDEAGQVAPEIGFGPFLLGKKALVVGDTAQIEPVWSLSPRIDAENARNTGVLPGDGDYGYWAASRGCAAADGSLMRMAQLACPWRVAVKPVLPDGLWLREHRRCDPEIIGYCNQLLYEGQLIPCREPVPNRILPAMGYANIQTAARKHGRSWMNEGEAKTIAHWIGDRRAELESHYGKPIGEIIGVVTPFKPQRFSILQCLDDLLEKGHRITVGTVHALQGAERDVVIFSPTYGEGFDGQPFFDRTPNMLNVAVSRAKDSFLVFGNMALFNVLKNTPAGLLGKHLFKHAANEIVDIQPKVTARFPMYGGETVLSGGPEHLEYLHHCLESVSIQSRVIITSPYVTPQALMTSAPYLEAAVRRGVDVSVYFDWHLTSERTGYEAALRTLKNCGVRLHSNQRGSRQFHNKTLALGEQEIVEGSYNWLSAVRNERSRFHRHERSLRSTGHKVADLIANFQREMDALCKPL